MEREALKLALEALNAKVIGTTGRMQKTHNAITAIKEALAQPAQEPVAWMVYTQDGQSVYVTDNPTDIQEGQRALPLYTAPPQREWVGLTDEQQEEMYQMTDNIADCRTCYFQGIADAEAAHNIGVAP